MNKSDMLGGDTEFLELAKMGAKEAFEAEGLSEDVEYIRGSALSYSPGQFRR